VSQQDRLIMKATTAFSLALIASGPLFAGPTDADGRPLINKLGTIDLDLVETTPIVFNDRLYRFEWVRNGYHDNQLGVDYFRLIDHARGEVATSPFGHNSWGDQVGTEFLAEAVYEGTERQFLTGWFPESESTTPESKE